MTNEELIDVIAALKAFDGEPLNVEVKRAGHDLPRRLWETLSAFSNTPGGGLIILGLDETTGFAAVGVAEPAKIQSDLASMCDQMEPPVRPLIGMHQVEGRVLVTAEVPEIPIEQKPCYYRGAGLTNGAFLRVGDGDRLLTPYEVQSLLASRGQPREDQAPVPGATVVDLDDSLIDLYVRRLRADEGSPFRSLTDEETLRTTLVLVPDGARLVPSIAGLLTLGRFPQRFFPSLEVTFVVYPTEQAGAPGPGGERFLDNRRLEGPIPTLVLRAMEALKRHMKRRAVVRGLFREDAWEYPEEALREALTNALLHRDYSPGARGTPVQVQMFPDKLSIVNPGGLFGPVTVERLGEAGISAARNQTLLRILEDLPVPGDNRTLCENRGSGIGAMLASLRRAGMQPPAFESTISTFRVTFPNHALLDESTLAWLAALGTRELSDNQRLALAYVHQNDAITNLQWRRLTGQDSREVSRDLRRLVDAGLLQSWGAGRWTTYRLPPDFPGPTRPARAVATSAPDRRAEIMGALAALGPSSRREVADRLGIAPATALQWLNRLIAEGRIERDAPPRSKLTKYRLKNSAGSRTQG